MEVQTDASLNNHRQNLGRPPAARLLFLAVVAYVIIALFYHLSNLAWDLSLKASIEDLRQWNNYSGLVTDSSFTETHAKRTLLYGSPDVSWWFFASKSIADERNHFIAIVAPWMASTTLSRQRLIDALRYSKTSSNRIARLYGVTEEAGKAAGASVKPINGEAPQSDIAHDSNATASVSHADEVFQKILDELSSSPIYKLRRYLNGYIQFLTMLLSCFGALRLFERFSDAKQAKGADTLLGVGVAETTSRDGASQKPARYRGGLDPASSRPEDPRLAELIDSVEEAREKKPTNSMAHGLLTAFQGSLKGFVEHEDPSEARARIDRAVERLWEDRDSSAGDLRFVIWAVPSVGFIGTVIGIGDALGQAHKVMDTTLDQMASIQDITASLGVAFDTTLVALVCSVLLMFARTIVDRIDESTILAFQNAAVRFTEKQLEVVRIAEAYRDLLEEHTTTIVSIFKEHFEEQNRETIRQAMRRAVDGLYEKQG